MEHSRGSHADDPNDTEPCHCDEADAGVLMYKEFREKQLERYSTITKYFEGFCKCAENETIAFRIDIPNGYWVFTPVKTS